MMTIQNIDLFDLYGNGTLVIKTNMAEPAGDLRYAWYIKLNGKLIHKGQYQRNPFTAFQLEHLGNYTVKAFVRNGAGEKVEAEAVFCATAKTSPAMAATEQEKESIRVTPKAEHISGMFWQFSVDGSVPADATIAWYIYQEGVTEPVVKSAYAPEQTYVHQFAETGTYHAKAFVLADGIKRSAVTGAFAVTD